MASGRQGGYKNKSWPSPWLLENKAQGAGFRRPDVESPLTILMRLVGPVLSFLINSIFTPGINYVAISERKVSEFYKHRVLLQTQLFAPYPITVFRPVHWGRK